MSTLKVDTLKNGSSSSIDFPQNLKIGGNGVMQGYTSSATEPVALQQEIIGGIAAMKNFIVMSMMNLRS